MSKDGFEKGVFWELFKDLESQFQRFLEYVPYFDENKNVRSFKLLNLILSIGGYVDSAFKEMARYPDFSEDDNCREILQKLEMSEENIKEGKAPITVPIWLSLMAFENIYKLSEKQVIFKRIPQRKTIIPFKPHNLETNEPKWWGIYNGLKHDLKVNISEANLQNTLHALASAFLLNAVHRPSALRLFSYRVLRVQYTAADSFNTMSPTKSNMKVVRDWLKTEKGVRGGIVETPLFIYYFENKK